MTYKSTYFFTALLMSGFLLNGSQAKAHERHGNDRYSNYYKGECREYTQDIWVHGRKRVAAGTACYEGRGEWRIVSSNYNHHKYHAYRNAGPVVILPQKYARYQHKPHVTYKRSPTVIYKDTHSHNWGYQFPVKNKHHKHSHKNKNQHDHYSYQKYDNGGVTFEFNW